MLLVLVPACGDGGGGGDAAPLPPVPHAAGNAVVAQAAGTQMWLRMVPDADGGAFVFWIDTRSATFDVYIQRLNSLGAPLWDPAGVAVTTGGTARFPGLWAVADGAGGAIVLWTDRRGDDDIYAQRVRSDGTFHWTADGVPALGRADDLWYVRAVSDGAGGAILFAQEYPYPITTSALYTQRLSDSGVQLWGAGGVQIAVALIDIPVPLTRAVDDGAGGAVVTWSGASFDGIYAQRVSSAGAPLWGVGGVVVGQVAGQQAWPDLIADGVGGAILAWSDDRSGDFDVYAQKLNGLGQSQWTAGGVPVLSGPASQSGPRLVPDGAGGVILAAYGDYSPNRTYNLCAQRVNVAGAPQWGAGGVDLVSAIEQQQVDDVASDGQGGLVVVWSDFRSRTNHDVYAQRLNGAGAPLWGSNGRALATAAYDQISARIVRSGSRFILAWEDRRLSPESDLFGQSLGFDGLGVPVLPAATETGPWHAFNEPVCTFNSHKVRAYGASDGAGGALLLWYDQRPGGEGYYVQRLDLAGKPLWAIDGVQVSGYAWTPADRTPIVSDGAGGAIVCWHEVATDNDVKAQRVGADGSLLWGPGGLGVCTAVTDQTWPSLVTDGAGGAIVVWEDVRDSATTGKDLYAQRLNAAGVAQWTAQGVPFSTSAGYEAEPRLAPDGASGVVATWREDRNAGATQLDVFAQRLDASGARLWGVAGSPVSATVDQQNFPALSADGLGGWIVAWLDSRGGGTVYAQRLNAAGAVQWAVDGLPVGPDAGPGIDLVGVGSGGAIVLWPRQVPNEQTILAQRLDALGALQWAAAGVEVTAGPMSSGPQVQADGAGGVWVGWTDGDVNDLRLQRLDATGVKVLTPGGAVVSTAFSTQTLRALVSDGDTGIHAIWFDTRCTGSEILIYAQHLTAAGVP